MSYKPSATAPGYVAPASSSIFRKQVAFQAGSTTTWVNSTDLVFPVVAGTYVFMLNARAYSATNDNIRYRWTCPSGTNYFASSTQQDPNLDFGKSIRESGVSTTDEIQFRTFTSVANINIINGTFIVTNTGNIQLQFSIPSGGGPGSSPALDLGSYIAVQKMA